MKLGHHVLASLLGLAIAPACMIDGNRCDAPVPVEIDPAGAHYRYVVDSIQVAATPSEVTALGLNLDGDVQGRPDNAFGQVLATVLSFTEDEDALNAEIAGRILAAELIQLFDVQATDLGAAEGAGVLALVGTDADADLDNNLDGTGQFRVRLYGDPMGGDIVDGELSASLGTVPMQLALPNLDAPVILTLRAAQIAATVDQNGLTGKIGGGISEEDIDQALIPAVQFVVEHEIAKYCDDSGCVADSPGETLSELYDVDHDGVISLDEVRQSSLTRSLLATDLDLLSDGILSPSCDGEKDSLSIGLGFTAVPASFPIPGEAS